MSCNICDLLLGTDLFDRKKNLTEAKRLIDKHVGLIISESKILKTKPVDFTSDTMFLNQIIVVETELSPNSLLRTIKSIEKKMGRIYLEPKKGEKYTSRLIDIDILKFNRLKYKAEQLTIPHPQVIERDFIAELYK